MKCYLGFGLTSLINYPTRCNTSGSSSLIGHTLSNITCHLSYGVIHYLFTDHYQIFLSLGAHTPVRNSVYTKSVFNSAKFVALIRDIDWCFVGSEQCAEEAFSDFSTKLSACITQCTSTTYITKWFRSPRNPWITPGLLRSISKKILEKN